MKKLKCGDLCSVKYGHTVPIVNYYTNEWLWGFEFLGFFLQEEKTKFAEKRQIVLIGASLYFVLKNHIHRIEK
jgi:uncharacterized protein involved in cysteine biosynthesis